MPIRDQQKVRLSAVAGRFYDAAATALRQRMAETESTLPPADAGAGILHGAVLPHAGYIFSLSTAMRTLLPWKRSAYKRIILLGPPHYVGFRGLAGADFTSWRTPFGDLPTDVESLEQLIDAGNNLFAIRNDAHIPEHSLEVELPLIQYFWGNIPILPLLVGSISVSDCAELGRLLAELDQPGTLWIISSDYTHYGHAFNYLPFGIPVARAKLNELDRRGAELAAKRDLSGFIRYLSETGATICGANPQAVYLEITKSKTELAGEVTAISDSGVVSGDYNRVVGYAGIRFVSRTGC